MITEIFAPKELSQKLREIGFDEPCIAIYSIHDNELKGIIQGEEKLIDNFILGKFTCSSYSGVPAPTWEQVFKWFRERGYHCYILQSDETLEYWGELEKRGKHRYSGIFTKTYEQARENLALELIELYGQRTNKK